MRLTVLFSYRTWLSVLFFAIPVTVPSAFWGKDCQRQSKAHRSNFTELTVILIDICYCWWLYWRFSVLHWFANEPAEVCWYWRRRGYSSKFGPQTVLDGSNTINPPTIGPVYAQHVLTALRVEQMVCVICNNSHNVIDFPGQNLHLYKWNLPTEFFLKQSWIVGKMTAARLVYYSSFA